MRALGSAPLVLAALVAVAPGCGDESVAPPPPSPGWTKDSRNPVLSPGPPGSWDALGVGSPYVLQLDAITYAMWYTGRDSVGSQIGLATSNDGVNWRKHGGNPILGPGAVGSWDALEVADPCVLYDGSSFVMYYVGRADGARSIGFATSGDAIQWDRSAANPVLVPGAAGTSWDDRHVYTPWVRRTESRFEMWYGGSGAATVAIGFAVSIDGSFWSKNLAPVLEPQVLEAVVTAPCVVASGSSYRMWYAAYHESPSGGTVPGVIDLAQSPDGIEWTWQETILSPGPPGAWDERTLRSACVLSAGSEARVWYAGEDASGTSAIGLAFAP